MPRGPKMTWIERGRKSPYSSRYRDWSRYFPSQVSVAAGLHEIWCATTRQNLPGKPHGNNDRNPALALFLEFELNKSF